MKPEVFALISLLGSIFAFYKGNEAEPGTVECSSWVLAGVVLILLGLGIVSYNQ